MEYKKGRLYRFIGPSTHDGQREFASIETVGYTHLIDRRSIQVGEILLCVGLYGSSPIFKNFVNSRYHWLRLDWCDRRMQKC